MSKFLEIEEELNSYREELNSPNPQWPPNVQRALKCIQKNLFNQWLSVQAIRDKCLLKGSNFSTKFQYYVGISPKQYIIKHRLKAASQLLSKLPVDYPIMRIALAIGFSSHAAFTRTFKRKKGIPPNEFRAL